jgi:lipopolysaccharide/colanic/teichoic acid biosynthesis glycosyltransferase
MTGQPRYQNSAGSKLLFFCEILLITASFYVAALIDLDLEPSLYFLYEGGLGRLIFAGATILLAMYFHHLYTDVRVRSRVLLVQQLCEVFGLALVAQSLVVYMMPDWILPRWLMVYGVLFSLLAIFVWRVLYSQFVLNIVRRHRIVFVGLNQTVREIAREIASAPGWGYEVLGYINEGSDSAVDGYTGKYLGSYTVLPGLARKLRPDRIVVGLEAGLENRAGALPVNDLLQLHYEGLAIEEANRTYEAITQRVCIRDLDEQDLIFSRDLTPSAHAVALQRTMDRVVAFVLLVLCLPVMAVLAALLRLISWEPALIKSRRAGYNGKPFDVQRFRSEPKFRWLYGRFYLDALPELFNVLRGEMALVGPRPESPETAAERSLDFDLYQYRFNVPPGITGWAQINLTDKEYEADPLNTLEYDLYYIKHMSQALKTYILMTTFKNRLIWGDRQP